MKAIILAGGLGTRLRPLSCTRPKLLFPLLNKPLLDRTLEKLKEIGVDQAILAVKHMAEVFMQRYGESKNGIKISYSIEKIPMRTGGAIKYAEEIIGHKDCFLVLNGDIFTTINFNELVKKHRKNKTIGTIALYKVKDPSRYGTVELTENDKITKFVEKAPKEKAPSNLINAGIYVLDPDIFEYIPGGQPVSIEHEVFPKLAEEKQLSGYKFKDIWIDIGKPEDFLNANKILLDSKTEKEPPKKHEKNLGLEFINPINCDAGVIFGKNSKIGPYTTIGKKVKIGNNVIIRNSIIFPYTTIGNNVKITGSLIGELTKIGSNTIIKEGSIIGDYVKIKENIKISKNVTICHSKEVNESISESKRII